MLTLTGEVDSLILTKMNACLHRANISCANLKTMPCEIGSISQEGVFVGAQRIEGGSSPQAHQLLLISKFESKFDLKNVPQDVLQCGFYVLAVALFTGGWRIPTVRFRSDRVAFWKDNTAAWARGKGSAAEWGEEPHRAVESQGKTIYE